jgi:pyruvate formate lyase activating enzyme
MCKVGDGEAGYCGIRQGDDGNVVRSTRGAVLQWYYDKLPTNCVAEFVCPSGTECGNLGNSHGHRSDTGLKNLAVFYGACNFSCLFCQNWHFRRLARARSPVLSAKQLAAKADRMTACICYFGGDPVPQIEHAIETSRIVAERDDKVRICFETNGSMNRRYLREMAELSYESGGCVKFDLKTWNVRLNRALCGTDNRWTLNNFRWLADYSARQGRRSTPFLVASTLLVPGYIEEEEVAELAGFIASLDSEIPYSLLAFSPAFQMMDLPRTSASEAKTCREAAKSAGLRRVRLGNAHLVG